MRLFYFLVICGTPVTDAVKAEAVVTAFKNTKALAVCKDWFQTDNAVLVTFILYSSALTHTCFSPRCTRVCCLWRHALWMCMLATISKFTIALQKILTNDPVSVVLQEIVYHIIVIIHICWHWDWLMTLLSTLLLWILLRSPSSHYLVH